MPVESTVRKLLIVPAASLPGNPGENALLAQTVTELTRLGLSPKEVALDGGFAIGPTSEQLEDLQAERVFISGRQQPGSRRTQRRLQRSGAMAPSTAASSPMRRPHGARSLCRT